MPINGPKPLDIENAEATFRRVFFDLQKIIAADLLLAKTDDRRDRAVMGAVDAQRVLLQAFPESFSSSCHTEDFMEWKTQFLEWFDANAKRFRMKKAERDQMRQMAESEFDQIIELSNADSYRFVGKLQMADDKQPHLRYHGKDGRLVEIPPLQYEPRS